MLLAAVATCVSSCHKDNPSVTSPAIFAYIMTTNAAENSASQDLLIDNGDVVESTVTYAQSSGYLNVVSGPHAGQFVTTTTTTINSTFGLTLQGGQYYSIYYTGGKVASSAVIAQDDLSAPDAGKAKVRFVQLSPAAPAAVDFGMSATNKMAIGITYKSVSPYYQVDANTNFFLYPAGSATASLSIPAAVQAGKIYTIYISGASAATIGYHIIVQN